MKYLKLLFIPFLAFSLLFTSSCGEDEEVANEICDNGIDDDGDGFLDCDDPDCNFDPACSGLGSDLRIKEDIQILTYGLETILKMESYSFKYKKSEGQHLGLMAQDIQKLVPEVVIDDPSSEDDIMAIRYQELIPVLINAIKEQQVMIEELQRANLELAERGY